MASHGLALVQLRRLSSTASSHARHLCFPSPVSRTAPHSSSSSSSSSSSASSSSPPRRVFFQTTSRARRPNPREDPKVLLDDPASAGRPWYRPRRLRSLLFLARRHSAGSTTLHSSPRYTILAVAALTAAALWYSSSPEVVPVSGRKRPNLSHCEDIVRHFSDRQFQTVVQYMEKTGLKFLPAHDARVRRVKRVAAQLVAAAGPAAREAAWEVYVVDLDGVRAANASVLPGGTILVTTGLLRLAQTDGQLAAVLAHEMAHNVANHVTERLAASTGVNLALAGLVKMCATTALRSVAWFLLGWSALGLLWRRPMARKAESEADYIGLMIMADACYDPRESIAFWERVQCREEELSWQPPEILSTHPSIRRRVEQITNWLPEALERRKRCDCMDTRGFAALFQRALDRSIVIDHGI